MKPLFEVKDEVRHKSTKKTGTVIDRFDSGNDWRYLVRLGREYWSIPQWALQPKSPSDLRHLADTPTVSTDIRQIGSNDVYDGIRKDGPNG